MSIGSRYAPPAKAAVVYQGGPRDGTEGVLDVPGGLPTTEVAPEDGLGFYSRREQLPDGRWSCVGGAARIDARRMIAPSLDRGMRRPNETTRGDCADRGRLHQ